MLLVVLLISALVSSKTIVITSKQFLRLSESDGLMKAIPDTQVGSLVFQFSSGGLLVPSSTVVIPLIYVLVAVNLYA